MKILIVSFLLPHARALNGAAMVMHGQLALLTKRHQVTLVVFSLTSEAERQALGQLRASGVRLYVLGETLPTSIIRYKRQLEGMLGRLRGWPALGNPSYADPRLPRLLDRMLKRERFDLLQVENIGLGKFQYEPRIPSILIEHEVLSGGPYDLRDGHHYQTAIWRQFDRIQTFTPRDAAAICTAAPELAARVRINPFGIDAPLEVDIGDEQSDTVAFIGGFNHAPNVDAALWLGNGIMPILRRLRPGIQLMIVGSDPPRSVRALGSHDITVTGRVPEVEPYLKRAAVVLAPVRAGGGMRMKVLHAMAWGRPVVTTLLGVEGLIGDPRQLPLIIAESGEDIAHATARLMESYEARSELGQRARAFVAENHSWSAYGQRLEATYDELHPRHSGTTDTDCLHSANDEER